MGGTSSKQFERNKSTRRSQRQNIKKINEKVEALTRNIRKFSGTTTDDSEYKRIKTQLERHKKELMKKGNNIIPEAAGIWKVVLANIDDSLLKLENRIQENAGLGTSATVAPPVVVAPPVEPVVENTHHIDDEEEEERQKLEDSKHKRQTVELKVVQFKPTNDVTTAEVHNSNHVLSAEQKRQSILKVGVPVMPGAMLEQLERHQMDDFLTKIDQHIQVMKDVELEISNFVGVKNGEQYSRIERKLKAILEDLNGIQSLDEDVLHQLFNAKQYANANLNFLDNQAVGPPHFEDDDVFVNNVGTIRANEKLKKLMKTTQI